MFDEWGTPLKLFRRIQREMDIIFTLDPCTSKLNRLDTNSFYTEKDNGLSKSWEGEIVFMNPPYSRPKISSWINKARDEAFINDNTIVVGLLPLRTPQWFRKYILPYSKIIRNLKEWKTLKNCECGIFFLEKRVQFIDPKTGVATKDFPNFDSILVIWR